MGTEIVIVVDVLHQEPLVAFRTISLPNFNGFCSKLTEIALLIYFM